MYMAIKNLIWHMLNYMDLIKLNLNWKNVK